jgi:hypothetical protein
MNTPVGPLSVLLIFGSLTLTAIMMTPSLTSVLVFLGNSVLLFLLRWVARHEALNERLQ